MSYRYNEYTVNIPTSNKTSFFVDGLKIKEDGLNIKELGNSAFTSNLEYSKKVGEFLLKNQEFLSKLSYFDDKKQQDLETLIKNHYKWGTQQDDLYAQRKQSSTKQLRDELETAKQNLDKEQTKLRQKNSDTTQENALIKAKEQELQALKTKLNDMMGSSKQEQETIKKLTDKKTKLEKTLAETEKNIDDAKGKYQKRFERDEKQLKQAELENIYRLKRFLEGVKKMLNESSVRAASLKKDFVRDSDEDKAYPDYNIFDTN